jgi:hypothetical protein
MRQVRAEVSDWLVLPATTRASTTGVSPKIMGFAVFQNRGGDPADLGIE